MCQMIVRAPILPHLAPTKLNPAALVLRSPPSSTLKGYRMFTLARTEARGDGVACFVKDGVQVLDRQV